MGDGIVMDQKNSNECNAVEIISEKSGVSQLSAPPTPLHHFVEMESSLFWGFLILSIATALIIA